MLHREKRIDKPVVQARSIYDDFIPDLYHTFQILSSNVADALEQEVDEWICSNPVLIDAATGMGKTSLVYKHLIPRAIQQGKNILLLSNRIALSVQQKTEVMKIINSPKQGKLTAQGILETEDFGPVRVMTYHRLPHLIHDENSREWVANLLYVAADEIHILSADSLFNHQCGYYLHILTKYFAHAVRVYMTATSWDILYPLSVAEQEIHHVFPPRPLLPWHGPREFIRYYFPADFGRYQLRFFSALEDLIQPINAYPEQKWMIFVDSKEKGYAFSRSLGKRASYLDADRKGSPDMQMLLQTNQFNAQVLVTTAVLDCGINIHDSALVNVAIVSDSRTSFVQMLGRKRCGKHEKVTVWVQDITPKQIASRYNRYTQLLKWKERYEGNPYDAARNALTTEIWEADDPQVKNLFTFYQGKLYPNNLAFFTLERKRVFYDEMRQGNVTFRSIVESWLGITRDNLPERLSLDEFCQSKQGMPLTVEEQTELRRLIVALNLAVGNKEPQPSRVDLLKRQALNNRLGQLNMPWSINSINGEWCLAQTEPDGSKPLNHTDHMEEN